VLGASPLHAFGIPQSSVGHLELHVRHEIMSGSPVTPRDMQEYPTTDGSRHQLDRAETGRAQIDSRFPPAAARLDVGNARDGQDETLRRHRLAQVTNVGPQYLGDLDATRPLERQPICLQSRHPAHAVGAAGGDG